MTTRVAGCPAASDKMSIRARDLACLREAHRLLVAGAMMNALKAPKNHYSFVDYLRLCEDSNVRLEFWNGDIYAMGGGTYEHSRLSARIVSLLDHRRSSGCVALESNARIRPLTSERATYADAVLVCGEVEFHPEDPRKETVTNPKVIVEVLSESTADDDKTEKFEHYRLAPSLTDYVLISQGQQHVEVRTRQTSGWLVQTFGAGDTVELQAGIRFTVDELYAR